MIKPATMITEDPPYLAVRRKLPPACPPPAVFTVRRRKYGLLGLGRGASWGLFSLALRSCSSSTLHTACPLEYRVLPEFGVVISQIQYRIPDIVVVRSEDVKFDKASTARPPVLVVEVASPSTAAYDRNRKRDVYAGFGISSYWIVKPDLEKPSITAFELKRGAYRQSAEVTGDEVFKPTRPFPCEIVPSALVAGPWWR